MTAPSDQPGGPDASALARRDVEVVHATCALEGGTLRPAEVADVLATGRAPAPFPFCDYAAAIGERDALAAARTASLCEGPVGAEEILRMFETLFQDILPIIDGWKRGGTREQGEDKRRRGLALASCADIVSARFSRREAGPEVFDVHAEVMDALASVAGAGRVARFATNLGLILGGHPPVAITGDLATQYHLLVELHSYERRHGQGGHEVRDAFRLFMSRRVADAVRQAPAYAVRSVSGP